MLAERHFKVPEAGSATHACVAWHHDSHDEQDPKKISPTTPHCRRLDLNYLALDEESLSSIALSA